MLLEGVKVVELSSFIAAPCCAKMLGDWGAEVIKIEPIEGDGIRVMGGTFKSPASDDENPMFELENGNKKGVSINVKSKEGVEILHKLLSEADIFVTNVRVQALEKMGIAYDQIKDKYPGLIFSQILGYGEKGPLKDIIKGKDVFIGVSGPGAVTKEMVESMSEKPIILAMANPAPEIMPEEAKLGGAFIMGTGRSDFPNQVNNVLAFPGIFRGALDVKAKEINEEMKIAAAYAIANTISDEEICPEYILPDVFNKNVVKNVAKAVKEAAIKTKVNRI